MPELKFSIDVDAAKLRESFDKLREAVRMSPALRAQLALGVKAAVKLFKNLGYVAVCPPTLPPGTLRRALEPPKPKRCMVSDRDAYACLHETGNPLAKALRKGVCMVTDASDIIYPERNIKGGQGIVFRAIGWWFRQAREWEAAWIKPLSESPVYNPLRFRGRTGKSTKAPVRFKGWKGGR